MSRYNETKSAVEKKIYIVLTNQYLISQYAQVPTE